MSTLLTLTLQGGLLILATALVRALLQSRIPRRAFVALWLMAALRLLLPIQIESPVSIYRAIPRQTAAIGTWERTPSTVRAVPLSQEGGKEEALSPYTAHLVGDGGRASGGGRPLPMPSEATPTNWPLIAYVTGATLLVLYFLCAYIHHRRRFRRARPITTGPARAYVTAHGGRRVRLLAAPNLLSPIAYGLIRPRIALPESALNDGPNLPYILAHELTHIQRFDAPLKLVVAAALCAHWFNPCAWLLFFLYNRDVELACDERVLKGLDLAQKKTYAHLLLTMQIRQSPPSPLTSGFSRHCIKERITAIMRYKKTSALSVILALTLVLGMTCAFATGPVEPRTTPAAENLTAVPTPIPTDWNESQVPFFTPIPTPIAGDDDTCLPDPNGLNLSDEEFSLRSSVVAVVDQMFHIGGIRGVQNMDLPRVNYIYEISHVPLEIQSGLSEAVQHQLEAAYEQYRYVFRLYILPDGGDLSYYYIGAMPTEDNFREGVALIEIDVPYGEELPRGDSCLRSKVEYEESGLSEPGNTPVPPPAPDPALTPIQEYDLVVDVSDQMVYAYAKDTGESVREMRCSTGLESTPTPLGEFQESTGPGARWHYFKSFNCWAQYAWYIEGDILFHSVLSSRRGGDPTASSVSSLGSQASSGSVRLSVQDAKWIWENCAAGTRVTVRN